VEFFTDQVLQKGGFKPDTTKKVSTVDHLWINRLLKEFTSNSVEKLLPQPFLVFSNFPRLVQLGIALAYLAVGGWGIYMGIINRNLYGQVPAWKFVSWALLATIFIPLFVRVIYDAFLKGES
jgi:hypothetical protein